MSDINSYANELLLDFVDAFHQVLKSDLEAEFGSDWFERGVVKHIGAQYLDRTKKMLESPMRVVDMGKADDELYGVEHLANIIDGNWKLYVGRFRDKERTKVYLSETAELRHNVSHRRRHHVLRPGELLRFAQNARALLEAIGSEEAGRFSSLADSIGSGATPWGTPLGSSLPPHDEIVSEFVGRPKQLRALGEWLAGDSPQMVLWGYGGAGKTATAYEFAQDIAEAAPEDLQAVCWISAKRQEYVDGLQRERLADFTDLPTLVAAVWRSLYGAGADEGRTDLGEILAELRETPVLLVVDDLDTVLGDQALAQALLYDFRTTAARILYTSREKIPGVPVVEIPGFSGPELQQFIRVRALEHEVDPDACAAKAAAIESVTGGYPLFVDDLLRYARIDGLTAALGDWGQRKGDAAREYALRRQLTKLGSAAADVLIAISVANRSVTALEASTVVGRSDDDIDHAVRELERWRLINRVSSGDEGRPGFDVNANTRRLVLKTFKGDPRIPGFQAALQELVGDRMPMARRRAIDSAAKVAHSLVLRGDVVAAADHIKSCMTGELVNSPDLYAELGWVYGSDARTRAEDARRAFDAASKFGSRSEQCYWRWAAFERDLAEANTWTDDDDSTLAAWRRCTEAALLGIERCGQSQALCQMVGYAHSREAKTLEHLQEFIAARAAYRRSVDYLRRALVAPASEFRPVPRGVTYRALVIAWEGLDELGEVVKTMVEWEAGSGGGDEHWQRERERLVTRHPSLAGLL